MRRGTSRPCGSARPATASAMSRAKARQRLEVIRTWLRHPTDHHAASSAGLHLLEAVAVDQRVQVRVERVEEPDEFVWRGVACALCVAGDVGEQNRRVFVSVSNDVVRRVFQPFGDRRG